MHPAAEPAISVGVAVAPAAARAPLAYPSPVRPPPLDFEFKVLLALGLAIGSLHLAWAGVSVLQMFLQKNVSWFSGGYWGWFYVVTAGFRAIVPSLLVVGVIGTWRQRPGSARVALLATGALVLLGVVELVSSTGALILRPVRSDQLAPTLVSLIQGFVERYSVLLFLAVRLRKVSRSPIAVQP